MLKMLMRREYAVNRQNRVFGVLLIFVPSMALIQHCTNNDEFCTHYFCQYCVVVNRRCHRIASFLRLVLTKISGAFIHRYLCNAVLIRTFQIIRQLYIDHFSKSVYTKDIPNY